MWTRILGLIGAWILRLQCKTWRVEIEGLDRLDGMLGSGKRFLVVFWHGQYLPLFALLRGRKACVFASHSFRGAIICEICRHFGYTCIRLPPRYNGVNLLDLMRAELVTQTAAALAVDGPLGPYHVVKRGAIELASSLGFLLVPVSTSSRRKHVMNRRWDRMELPGMFTRMALVVGEPLRIPSGIDHKDIPFWEDKLHQALEAVDQKSSNLVSRD
ncbi:lysophospholipid acyltransferase family protein [Microbulbifer hainanensis]|uniref:lysophospholipid acyltransferase family protein n=1 Tax=Microbulbifer hainanensis TaxID=2735675 RepID=UPI0018679337|nr:DUF374 domain-containing protein [Microbulbifer hainanensis]